jgi:hypothetical protein
VIDDGAHRSHARRTTRAGGLDRERRRQRRESRGREARIADIAGVFGDEAYRALATEADERFADESELKSFLSALIRPEARELIYGTVLDAALPNGVDQHESSLLGWLATTWNITIQFDA